VVHVVGTLVHFRWHPCICADVSILYRHEMRVLRHLREQRDERAAATASLGVCPPPDGWFDPAHILGCAPEQALRLFHGRPVTPGEAEGIAEKSYAWRSHLHDPDSYWVTASQAAAILGVPAAEVKRFLDHKQLPHVRHATGVRLMRRKQIEKLASAWQGQVPSLRSNSQPPNRAARVPVQRDR
jgi:hypothetical protein